MIRRQRLSVAAVPSIVDRRVVQIVRMRTNGVVDTRWRSCSKNWRDSSSSYNRKCSMPATAGVVVRLGIIQPIIMLCYRQWYGSKIGVELHDHVVPHLDLSKWKCCTSTNAMRPNWRCPHGLTCVYWSVHAHNCGHHILLHTNTIPKKYYSSFATMHRGGAVADRQ